MFRSLGRKSGAKALSDAEMAAPGSSGKKSSKRDKKEKSRSLALRNKGDVEALEREAQAKWGDDFSSNAAADVEKTDVVDSDGLEKLTGYARKFASAIKDLNSAFPVRDADGKSKVLRAMQNVQTCIREVGSQFQVSSGPPLRRGKKLVDMIKAWDVEQEPLKPREFQKACDELVETYTRVVSECLIGFNSGLSMDLDDELDAYGEDRDIAGYLLQDAVIVLNRRCKEWSKYVGEIIKYLKDRVGHEKDYYAAMTKIARLSADAMSEKGGAVATGSFHNAMSIVLRTHENQAQKRADFTINVLQTVIDVLHLKRTDHDKSRKLLKEQFVEQEKKLHKALKALESARSSYHSASNNWEKAALAKDREESAGTDAKIEKRAKDEETARRSAADADDAYRAQLAATNKTITEFEAYYKTTLRDYKRLNEDCEEATKTAIMKFLELERDLYTPFAGRLSDVMVTGSKIDHVRDVAEYVRVESEGNALSHPIHEYEEYQMSRQAANYLGLDSIRKPPPSFAPSKKEPAKVSKPKKNLFGHPLDDITAMSPNNVPQVIVSCVSEIEKRGMDCIGIYRMAGVKSQIENLCNDFDAGRMIDLGALIDMHVLGSVVKLFFRQMPEPLIAYDVYEKLIGSGKETSPSFLRQTLKELPTRNLATLEYLIEHLERVASKSGVNKMKEENLGIVFGPTLMKARNENNFNSLMEMPKQVQIVTTLISNFNTVFRTQPPAPNSPTVAPVGGVAMAGAADVGLRKSPPPTSKKPVVSPPASHPKASPPVIAPPAAVRGPDPVMMHDAASRQGSTEEDRVAVEEARRRAQAAMTEFGSGMNNGAPTLTLGSTVTAPPRVPEETRDEQSKSEPPTTKAKPAKRRPFLARGMMAESSDEEEDEDPAAAEAAASAAFAERQREAELAKARRVEEEERERAAALEKQKQREHEEQERARKEREEAEQRKAAREERERKQREDEERAAAAARAEQEAQENRKRQASLRAEDRQARLRDLQRKREGKTSDDEADQQHQHAPLSSTASSGSAGVPAEQVDPALAAQASEADRVAREAAEVAAKAKKQLADTPRPPDELKQCVCNKKARFRCTICRQQFYCSKECQTSDWPTHKGGCSKPNPEQLAAMKQREEERKKALARYEELSKSIAPLQAAADAAEADARRVNSELETSRREAAAKQQQSHAAEEEKRRRAHEQQQQQQREAEERAAADARKRQQEEAEAARQREAQEQQQAALRAQQQAAAARARAEEEEAARQKEEEEASSQAAAAAAMAAQQAAAARARAEAAQAAEAEKRRREEEEAAAQQSSAEQARQQAAAAAQAQAAAAAAAAQRAQAEQAEAKAKAEAEAKAKADAEAAAKAQAEAAAKAQAEAAAKAQAEAAAAQAQAAAAAAQAQAAAAAAQAQAAATASAAPPAAAAPAAAGADEQLPVALYDYTARTENEVSFQRGDPIRVFQQVNADWLHGEVRGANGYIPCKYVSGY